MALFFGIMSRCYEMSRYIENTFLVIRLDPNENTLKKNNKRKIKYYRQKKRHGYHMVTADQQLILIITQQHIF